MNFAYRERSRKDSLGLDEEERTRYFPVINPQPELEGTGISEKKAHWQGSGNLGTRGIASCTKCGGSGYKSSTNKSGTHKTCEDCAEIISNKFLIRNRGMDGCKYCNGDGFLKSGSKDIKLCNHCLRITGYCSNCLDTGFKLGTTIKCDHRRT